MEEMFDENTTLPGLTYRNPVELHIGLYIYSKKSIYLLGGQLVHTENKRWESQIKDEKVNKIVNTNQ